MTNDITLAKSGFTTVTIHTTSVDDNITKQLFPVRIPVFDSSVENTKIVDYKMITHLITVKGFITADNTNSKTAVEVRDNLINMIKDANPIVLTYNYADVTHTSGNTGASLNVYPQKVTIKEVPVDDATVGGESSQQIQFDVMMSFEEGEAQFTPS